MHHPPDAASRRQEGPAPTPRAPLGWFLRPDDPRWPFQRVVTENLLPDEGAVLRGARPLACMGRRQIRCRHLDLLEGEYEAARTLVTAGNTKGGSITVPLTSCLTGLESAV
jgi:hypothetical protein